MCVWSHECSFDTEHSFGCDLGLPFSYFVFCVLIWSYRVLQETWCDFAVTGVTLVCLRCDFGFFLLCLFVLMGYFRKHGGRREGRSTKKTGFIVPNESWPKFGRSGLSMDLVEHKGRYGGHAQSLCMCVCVCLPGRRT